jgi:hypothetical protein
MHRISKMIAVATLACSTPSLALTTVYKSTEDLKDATNLGWCSPCAATNVTQFTGSAFSLHSATKLDSVSFTVVNTLGFWPNPVTIEIYRDASYRVGSRVFSATYAALNYTDGGNFTAIVTASLFNTPLNSGNYLIFFRGNGSLSLSSFLSGDGAAKFVHPAPTGPTTTLTGNTYTSVTTSIGYELFAKDASLAALANVPEPANWALLITGFGLAGATARRRRTTRPALT